MEPTTTFNLLVQARQGSGDAASLLFERYRRRLAVLVRFKLGEEWRANWTSTTWSKIP